MTRQTLAALDKASRALADIPPDAMTHVRAAEQAALTALLSAALEIGNDFDELKKCACQKKGRVTDDAT